MSDNLKQRVWWHSRRGMLELDLLLMPFTSEVFDTLDPEDQARYQQLLAQEDQDLWNWMVDRDKPDDVGLQMIINRILAHNEARS